MQSLDLLLIGVYALAMLVTRNRVATYASVLFILSYVVSSSGFIVGMSYFILNCFMYGILSYLTKGVTSVISFIIVIFQYIMSWDIFLYPTTNTALYYAYPIVTFALNALLIFSILKTWRDHAGSNSTDRYADSVRVFNL